MKIVVKIGGSVSVGETGPNFSYISRLVPVLKRLKQKNQLIVAIGGGRLTRAYGKSIENFHLEDEEKERIFIELISANVRFLAATLRMKPILSLEEVGPKTSGVMGGIVPGRSTDANAAIAARKIRADIFIKMTNVEGVYDRDPNRFSGAKLIRTMSFRDLSKLAPKGKPNSYGVLDSTAVKNLSAGKIKTFVINGKNPRNILDVIGGKRIGTLIQ